MARARLLLVPVAVVLAVLAVRLGPGGPEPGRAPERRLEDDRRDEPPPRLPPAAVFSPEAASVPLPVEARLPSGGDQIAPEDPEMAALSALAEQAMRQAGPEMREFGGVDAFLRGTRTGEWRLHQLPRDLVLRGLALLDAESAKIRLLAALALAAVELSPEDLAALERRLESEITGMDGPTEKNVVLALAFALHKQRRSSGLRRLEDALRRGEGTEVPDFRNGVAFVLALAADEGSSPSLRELLSDDPDRIVRKHAAMGLGRIGGEENRTALGGSLTTEADLEVRAWATLAAGRATPPGARADPALLHALSGDPDGEVRGAAAFALSRAGDDAITATLKEAYYRDDHPLARVGAVAGIARRAASEEDLAFLRAEGSPFLLETARTCDDRVSRHYAILVLSGLPPTEGRGETLREVGSGDESEWVRRAAIDALIATEGAAALPYLTQRRNVEPSEGLKRRIDRAIETLGSVGEEREGG